MDDTTNTGGQAASMDRTAAAAAPPEPPSQPTTLHPVSRFAAAVKRVLTFGSYPLSGKVAEELHAATEDLAKHFENGGGSAALDAPGGTNVDATLKALAAKRDELVASAKAELDDHINDLKGKANADLNAAVDQVRNLIKAAGDEQVAAVRSTKAA